MSGLQQPAGNASLVWSIDLSAITRRYAKTVGPDGERVEDEFRKVVALWRAHPEAQLTPSHAIDEYWHLALQDTVLYQELCDRAVGFFVDHLPGDGEPMDASFALTKVLYREQFGEPDATLWAQPGSSMSKRRS